MQAARQACAPSCSCRPAAPGSVAALAAARRCITPRQQQRARRRLAPCCARQPASVDTQQAAAPAIDNEALSEAYNQQMAKQMGWTEPFSYHFDRGLYLHEVWPGLLCGTQPRSPEEVSELAGRHGVVAMVNLQQDRDMEHWGVDFGANAARAAELGVSIARPSIVDFSPDSLRHQLPTAARELRRAMLAAAEAGGRVYVHCTAGLGRAPALCIAYLYWFEGFNLDDAYSHVTSIRPCGPRRDAIRAATADLMLGHEDHAFHSRPSHAFAFMNDDDRRNVQERVMRGA